MDDRFARAIELFDRANAGDPNRVLCSGVERPKELVFAERLAGTVLELDPDASEPLRLASRCQHIRRWEIPRDTEAAGRAGYLAWRAKLKKFHAEVAGALLREVGYPEETVRRVQALNEKRRLGTDPDCQTLEDALCLVFLRYQLDDLARGTERGKMVRILQKTWAKMGADGKRRARELEFSPDARSLLREALADFS